MVRFKVALAGAAQLSFPITKGDYNEKVMAWLGLSTVDAVPYENYLQR